MQNETWKSVDGYEGLYEVSDQGNVRSLDRVITGPTGVTRRVKGVKIKARINNGYSVLDLHKDGEMKTIAVHRLVLMAFEENPENKPFTNHKNGIRNDNRLENLEWCTPSENNLHAYKTGLKPFGSMRGTKNGRSKLTDKNVKEIRDLHANGYNTVEISELYNVSNSTVSYLLRGLTWQHVI